MAESLNFPSTREGASTLQKSFVDLEVAIGIAAEENLLESVQGVRLIADRPDGNTGSIFGRIAVGAGADAGKCNGADAVRLGQQQALSVAGGQESCLVLRPAVPDGTDCMDDKFRGESVALGDFGFTGGTSAERATFGEKSGPRGAVNGPVDSPAAEQ
jgi:hypothetical protein